MLVVNAILGAVLLFFGRSLYWAYVAIAGFLVGGHYANLVLADQADWVRLLAALVAGVLGAVLAMIAQRVAFALGGLFAGGYLALLVGQQLQPDGDPSLWLIVGGVLGTVIAALVMDWAIIVLSSLIGAGTIVIALAADPFASAIVYLLLFGVGVAVQARRMRRSRVTEKTTPSTG